MQMTKTPTETPTAAKKRGVESQSKVKCEARAIRRVNYSQHGSKGVGWFALPLSDQ